MAVSWLLLALLVVIVLLVAFKSQDLMFLLVLVKKYMFFIVFLVIVLFLVFSFTHISNTQGLDVSSSKGVANAVKVYIFWIGDVVGNVARSTGYFIKQDWVPAPVNGTG
ncbi:MAG: hypothetical protein CL811_12465 [Colwelliaceae bacterium]|nr:hypothetical protein [Colwelliaceae bacterium]